MRTRRPIRIYLALNALFALLAGFLGAYAFPYLASQLRALGFGPSVLAGSILGFLGATALLEGLASPVAAYFADRQGRGRAMSLGLALLGLALTGFSSLAWLKIFPWATAGLFIGVAGASQLLLALATSFFFNPADALVAELVTDLGFGSEYDQRLQAIYTRQAQVFGVFAFAGSGVATWFAAGLAARARDTVAASGGLDPSDSETLVWLAASFIALFGAIFAFSYFSKRERSPAARRSVPFSSGLRTALQAALQAPGIQRAMFLATWVSLAAASLIYLTPVLLTDYAWVSSGNSLIQWIASHYWQFFALLSVSKLVGPELSLRLMGSYPRYTRFLRWTLLEVVALAAAGLAFLPLSQRLLPVAILLIAVAKTIGEGIRPLQTSYLNSLTRDPSRRALALSVAAIPASGLTGVIALSLRSVQGVSPGTLPAVPLARAIPEAWIVLGLLGAASCVLLLRRGSVVARPRARRRRSRVIPVGSFAQSAAFAMAQPELERRCGCGKVLLPSVNLGICDLCLLKRKMASFDGTILAPKVSALRAK